METQKITGEGGTRRGGRKRTARLAGLAGLLLASAVAAFAGGPEGIPRDLARQRAERINNIRYALNYTLEPHAAAADGQEEIRFKLKSPGAVLLDFREGTVSKMTVNGKDVPVKMENGHIELPGELLKVSPNAAKDKDVEAARAASRATDNLGRPVGPPVIGDDIETLTHPGPAPDENQVIVEFTAPIAASGKAITRFEDKDDKSEYLYTLFVPMDGEMAFPCFDQPDMKAAFTLEVKAPEDWAVISNAEVDNIFSIEPGKRLTSFKRTQPISTYLFAFAAGPFMKIQASVEVPEVFVRKSRLKQALEEAPKLQQITVDGTKFLSDYFQYPFPFQKYSLVLLPGFPYGGMEHAGATFLREEAVLFRTAPTQNDLMNRDILLLHELTHQWFGDLVTMRWFDDLWLKEGFAQYMAYRTLDALKPKANVWQHFYQAMKPAAYRIDSTLGTTPIYQDIGNLKDAKSAYGAIVYSKAPGVLRQLAFVLGENNFRDGLRMYVSGHGYKSAEWSDLVGAFEKVSGKSLEGWARAYIQSRGMPQVDVQWKCDAEKGMSQINLVQHDVLGEGGVWPISEQLLLNFGASDAVMCIDWKEARTRVLHSGCPQYIFANDQDYAYGRFLLDPASRKAVVAKLGGVTDVFQRTLLWGALWDSVREAQMDPREYVDLALRLLPKENDETLAASVSGHMVTALQRYLSPAARAQFVAKAELLAESQMLHAPTRDMRIIWFRTLHNVAQTAKGRGDLKALLAGRMKVPGVELRPLDRWNMVTTLIALKDPAATTVLAAEEKRDTSGEAKKYAWVATAARADVKTKKEYFDGYLHDAARPEDWVQQSLAAFNSWNQSDVTLPYLKPALEALPQVKQDRKIFFVLAWLNAFIGGQQSAEAQAQVKEFLKSAALDKDLRLKVLEVSDELDRTVKIRGKYGVFGTGVVGKSGDRKAGKPGAH